jgi:diguanylate cyclase (GGDEF)-like protein
MLGTDVPFELGEGGLGFVVRPTDALGEHVAIGEQMGPNVAAFVRMLPAALASRRDFPALTDALVLSLSGAFDALAGYYSSRGPFTGQVFCCSGMEETEYPDAVHVVYEGARSAIDSLPGDPLTEFDSGLPARIDMDGRRVVFLWFDDSRAGAFVLYRDTEPFTRDELQRCAMCAAVAAEVVALGADLSLLEQQTRHDYLTGLLNRSFFERALPSEIERARRFNGHFSLVFMDLDGFKRFNDSFGHSRGDDMLRRVGAALSESIRRADTATRYGGDEFAIILPNTLPEDVVSTLTRLRERIEAASEAMGADATVSASFGVAHYPTDAETAEQLVATADSRLYHAKEQNRERTRKTGGAPRRENMTSAS